MPDVCFDRTVAATAHGRALGLALLCLVPVLLLLTLGFAFTVFGEVAAVLAVASLVAGATIVFRVRRER